MKFFQIRHFLAIIRRRPTTIKGMAESLEPYLRQFQIDQRLKELTKVDLLTVEQDVFDEVVRQMNVNMTAVNSTIKERRRNRVD